jgi:hypothetical protein
MAKYLQGKYVVKNPKKYVGDVNGVIYRSSWELKLFVWLDTSDSVKKWNSEEIIIPYYNPLDKKMHRYYVDAMFEYVDRHGTVKTALIEVKPKAQTKPPTMKKTVTKRFLREATEWAKNEAKWIAARAWCADRGIEFVILTEDHLFGKGST